MKLTLQQLANLCMHTWELRRELGFHMQNEVAFLEHLTAMSLPELRAVIENLGLLFRIAEEIGTTEIGISLVNLGPITAPSLPSMMSSPPYAAGWPVPIPETNKTAGSDR